MKPVHAAYTQEVYANLKPLHATWEPTQPVQLGDIGLLEGRAFHQRSNLKSLGITFSDRAGGSRPSISFGSSGTTEIRLKPQITAPTGVVSQKAQLELSFYSKGSVFFHAVQCETVVISEIEKLQQIILDRFKRGEWNPKMVVVTKLIRANATTIAVAGQSGASLTLEAQGALPTLDLANAELRFQVQSASRINYQLISEAGLVPLISLSKLQRRLFGPSEFGPGLVEAQKNEEEWKFAEIG